MTPRFFRTLSAAFTAFLLFTASSFAAADKPVPIKWLGGQPSPVPTGVSFGVPWPRGAVQRTQSFALTGTDGKAMPVQTWPLAFWPDGSLKWIGVAAIAGPESGRDFQLSTAVSPAGTSASAVQVRRSDTTYIIDTGRVEAVIPMHGSNLIDSIVVDGREVARDGRLTCVLQDGPDGDVSDTPSRER